MTTLTAPIVLPAGADPDIQTIQGRTICFVRRKYGRKTYTYPWIHWQGTWRAIKTDPYPTATFPIRALDSLIAAVVVRPGEYLYERS
jgi:hypothetical protein